MKPHLSYTGLRKNTTDEFLYQPRESVTRRSITAPGDIKHWKPPRMCEVLDEKLTSYPDRAYTLPDTFLSSLQPQDTNCQARCTSLGMELLGTLTTPSEGRSSLNNRAAGLGKSALGSGCC